MGLVCAGFGFSWIIGGYETSTGFSFNYAQLAAGPFLSWGNLAAPGGFWAGATWQSLVDYGLGHSSDNLYQIRVR